MTDAVARRLFFDGDVRYLNAYPDRGGKRMLPRPLSWMTEKDRAGEPEGTLFDLALADPGLEQAKPPSNADFCTTDIPDTSSSDDGDGVKPR